jgi:flagellar biosynthesis chaperone FliJ
MTRAWLPSLVRARQVQEDLARERVALARRHARRAELRAMSDDERVQGMADSGEPMSALAFVAASSARQAAAATLAAAIQSQARAEDQVTADQASLTVAAQNRLSAEKLAERDAAERRRAAATAMQQELDEIGSRMRRNDDAPTEQRLREEVGQ